jgi:formate dehydrogenase subunit delta
MSEIDARLAYMADQISRNFAAQGAEVACSATADHIIAYWDPWMKARGTALLDATPAVLTPAAAAALAVVRDRMNARAAAKA